MSETEAHSAHGGRAVGRRIRFLRGDLSQAEFAERVGVSRAALANYETGRTIPSPQVMGDIARAGGVAADFLQSGQVETLEELATSLGLGKNSVDELTKDEWAVVRLLSACNTEVVANVLRALVEGVSQDPDAKQLLDPAFAVDDLARLITVIEGHRDYQRGVRRNDLGTYLDVLAKRVSELRK